MNNRVLPVLDAGCGSGRDCQAFELDGASPIGIDLSAGLLAEARTVTGAPLVLGDVRDLPIADDSVGGVWCCAVLVHLDPSEALSALSEMRRVVVHGGALFVAVRMGSGSEWRHDDFGNARWFQLYQPDALGLMVERAGFEVLDLNVEPGVAMPGMWINLLAQKAK
ncbi:MAG: class I SAM-dependent methyltransferase [Actinomycetota bacterium]